MKFIELKKSLNNLQNVYLISGEDRFLCYSALEQIIAACNLTISEMNLVNMENVSADDVVASASIYPFADNFRVVVVKEFVGKPNQETQLKTLQTYLDNPMQTTILVFFSLNDDGFFKNLKNKLCHVDCSKLDGTTINNYITKTFDKHSLEYTASAVNLLALYCSYDMQRITSEVEKLISFSAGKSKITDDVIADLVVQDKEYQIFELAELISKNNAEKALDLVDTLGRKNGFSILSPLYNNYRRALYVSITPLADAALATKLGIKEFAVKMLKNQIKVFSPKKLKQIVDLLGDVDANIKKGKLKEDVAVKTAVLEILKIRNTKWVI